MARWKKAEETYLTEHAGDGAQAIAEALGRTVSSVKTHASRMGLSLVERHYCPKCARYTYKPLSVKTGWCRKCSVEASAGNAALRNRAVLQEIAAEEAQLAEAERRRQAIYSETNRNKKKLCSLRESCNRNATTKGDQGE